MSRHFVTEVRVTLPGHDDGEEGTLEYFHEGIRQLAAYYGLTVTVSEPEPS